MASDHVSSRPVELLSRFIQIRTDHPHPDYRAAVAFIREVCSDLLPGSCLQVHEVVEGKPNVVVTIPAGVGDDQAGSGGCIVLLCHMDVVPVEAHAWSSEPFSGAVTDGFIVGRGSQDMKSVLIAYVEALSRLRGKLRRKVRIVVTTDEEIGGAEGMKALVDGNRLDDVPIACVLDEGVPSPFPAFVLFNGERTVHPIKLRITGAAGHGSTLVQDCAAEKLSLVLHRIMEFRRGEVHKMKSLLDLGCVTTVNVNVVSGGTQFNVVPSCFEVFVDIRVPPDCTRLQIEQTIGGWLQGLDGVDYCVLADSPFHIKTPPDSRCVQIVQEVLHESGPHPVLGIFPGASDSRFLRSKGIPAVNITPFRNTAIALHDHNEKLPVAAFLEGIDVYEKLISALCEKL